jgi:hypothetical protein
MPIISGVASAGHCYSVRRRFSPFVCWDNHELNWLQILLGDHVSALGMRGTEAFAQVRDNLARGTKLKLSQQAARVRC